MKRVVWGVGLLALVCTVAVIATLKTGSPIAAEKVAAEPAEISSELKVEIFGTSWCPYCRKAKKFFEDRGISVVEYDIEKNRQAAEVKNRLDKKRGVPFVLINRKYGFHGFAPEIYEQMLEKARNPESS